MRKNHLAVLAIAALLLMAAQATAKEASKGIIDRIIDFIKSIIQKITGGSQTTTTTTTTKPPLCSPPYIQVGGDCCKDQNSNGICDKDEVTTTTTTTQATTTTKQTTTRLITTTEPTTTTTTLKIICTDQPYSCGTTVVRLYCYESAIYKQTQIPMCKNPGTPESYCIILQPKASKDRDCPSNCNPKTDPVSCN
ncbi:MAG: hypothetical protein PHG85_04115 [Candidatus Altiarchaeota archaeon]|nr:hypothetical protein [Candidatus Altiarchaeota archaeon]